MVEFLDPPLKSAGSCSIIMLIYNCERGLLRVIIFGFDLHVKVLGKFIARAVADDCLPPAFISNLGDTPEESNQR